MNERRYALTSLWPQRLRALTSNNGPQSLQLQTTLVALDEPDSGPGHWEEPVRLPVRAADASRRATETLCDSLPGAHATVDLQLSFSEIPPRTLRAGAIRSGTSPPPSGAALPQSRERRAGQRRACRGPLKRSTRSADSASLHRPTAGGASLRHCWTRAARYPPRTFARLRGCTTARPRACSSTLSQRRFVRDGTGEITADHSFFRAFGDVALQHLEHAARGWRRALDARYPTTFIPSILTSRRLASAVLDDLRVAALAELAARVRPPPAAGQAIQPNEQQMRFLFVRTLVALAPRRPYEAGRALVAVADRPTILAEALGGFEQPSYTGYPYAADLDGVDATLLAAWSLLPVSAPADRARGDRYRG